ncbi:aldolase/citrate lyase family protein [Caballeronia sp. LZ065]|uniref:HpcH/HpaI aldolase family protein n=1 Tax=Caballeronia sp. LZ065 TaxID=3038571 RepID=UPI002861C580|nr:aldolase/citrate lyase family protein [Caballeronia sp. LZ065]MDR5781252.1 aldolase/citrate lyase family protein [Caballeronia sp. LZ065]
MPTPEPGSFRARLLAREPLVGTFVKTTSHQTIEILGGAALDFIVLDAEHAPFSRDALDIALLAARAASLPALVRVPAANGEHIGNALDLGATGVIGPHVRDGGDASALAGACRFRGGTRGFSTSPRAGRYGLSSMTAMIDAGDAQSVSVAMIEDEAALGCIDEIAASEVDALFIGRADLALSCGMTTLDEPLLARHVEAICHAAMRAHKPVAMFVGSEREVAHHAELGVTAFVVGSDQSLLRGAALGMHAAAMAAAGHVSRSKEPA